MPFNKFKFIAAMILASSSISAFAAEHGAKPAEGAAAPAEGGTPGIEPASKEQRQYTEKSAKLKTLATRISDSEKEFQTLVEEKEHIKNNPEEIQRILSKMVEVAATRNKAVDDYNKLKADLDYRYPGEGQSGQRQYQTQTKKSVEELEGVAGLDELLTRTKKVVEKKFVVFADEEAARAEEEKKKKKPKAQRALPSPIPEAVPPPAPEEKSERLRLEK